MPANDEPLPLLPEEDALQLHPAPSPFSGLATESDEPFFEEGNGERFDPAAAMADEEALPEPLEKNSHVKPLAESHAASAATNTPPSEDGEESEGSFSLRTRSMAEVLAEQGDIKGALDIYHELAAAAVSPEESADLQQRIATLSAHLNCAQNVEQAQPPQQEESARGKDKLISMLEALAERVEARAQN